MVSQPRHSEEEAQPSMQPTRAAHERWTPRHPASARSRAATLVAVGLTLALTLFAGAEAAQANTLTGPTYSPDPRATVPMTVSVSGSADPTAALRLYVQQGGPCPTSADVEAGNIAAGATEVIAKQPVGPFSYSATFTPPAAGSYTLCAYLLGSGTTGTSASSTGFSVGPAPPLPPTPPTPAAPGATTDPPAAPGSPGGFAPGKTRCVVPTLKGRTYLGARLRIRRAGCNVGSVFRPDLRTSRRERARGRVLRVVLQYPKPLRVRKLGARVTLRLAYVAPPRSRR